MIDDRPDLCPMCQGAGTCTLGPPNGEYYVRLSIYVFGDDWSVFRTGVKDEQLSVHGDVTSTAMREVNRLAALGYELHSFTDSDRATTWTMQWRWR
jgi:hypothetical protein